MINNEPTNFGWKSAKPELHQQYTIPSILYLLPQRKSLNIIDVGCGNGFLVNYLSQFGHYVMGIDIAEDGIKIAKNAYPSIRFEMHSAYEKLDSLIDTPVDVIISSEVIEHLYQPDRFLENIFSVLRPGGFLILTTPYHGYLKNLAISLVNGWDKHHDANRTGGHIKFFSEKSLGQMLEENGFTNIKFRNAGRVPLIWKSMVCRAQKK